VLLNPHTLWLQEAGGERPTLYGDSYVLLGAGSGSGASAVSRPCAQRRGARRAGSTLVPWQRPGGLAPPRPASPLGIMMPRSGGAAPSIHDAALVVLPAAGPAGIVPFSGEPVALAGDGFIEAEAVDAEVLPAAGPDAPLPPSTTALVPRPPLMAAGIVPARGAADDCEAAGEGVYESFSASPRRAHKVKFTCRRCGATSIRPINIHAWREVGLLTRAPGARGRWAGRRLRASGPGV
jgi:hypothetical protein